MELTVNDLLAKIGMLTLERDVLQARVNELEQAAAPKAIDTEAIPA